MKKISLIAFLALLVSSFVFAEKPALNTASQVSGIWYSQNIYDIVTIANPSKIEQIVFVSVKFPGAPILLNCNGKIIGVKPFSSATCKTKQNVTWSSIDPSYGVWEVQVGIQ